MNDPAMRRLSWLIQALKGIQVSLDKPGRGGSHMHRGEGNVSGAEIGAVWPLAEECWEPAEAGQGRKWTSGGSTALLTL